jgi:TonB-dependent starch-binding outer membrane protein SusC
MKSSLLQLWLTIILLLIGGFPLAEFAYGKNILYMRSVQNQIQQEEITITGTVKDENGIGIPGANVIEKGTNHGIVTNVEGSYMVTVKDKNSILVFSYIGYKTQEIKVGDQTVLNVILLPDVTLIDEVVLVGYGTQKKSTLTGSVSTVDGSEIIKSPAMNVTSSIGGTIPGLVAVGQSGEPGEDYATLYIRGRSTLNDNSPLIVVDGVPNRSLERLDPATIESITVLKDASAAIYGSQAANGVILVTTKRGSAEKMVYSVNFTSGWSRPTRIPELTNSVEYAELANEVNYYDNRPPIYDSADLAAFARGDDPWKYPNTDWFQEVLKPWSFQYNGNITMSGGTDKMRSFVSLSARNQDGFFINSASKYGQYDIRANIDNKINKYIDLSVDASLRIEQRSFPTASSPTIFLDLMTALPMQVAYWPNGLPGPPLDPTSQNNPVVQATPEAGLSEGENYVFNMNLNLQVKIPGVEGLTFTSTGALDRGLNYTKFFSKHYTLYKWDGMTYDENNEPVLVAEGYGPSSLRQSEEISKEYLINSFFTYQRTFNVHTVNAVAGMEVIENNYNWFTAERRNFNQSYPAELNFGDEDEQYASGSNPGTNRWQNFFGRVNYAFRDKYIADFVWRYQGSSKFAPETRWGFFPGISLAYRISEEQFWKNSIPDKLISYLKLRASWGKTGNDLIPPYQFFSLYEQSWRNFITGDGSTHAVYYESLAGNSEAQWEEANQFNVGTDSKWFDGRLYFTIDYFNNLRTKILITQQASIPTMTGTSGKLPEINLGEVRNQGVDFELEWRDKKGNFNYSAGFNGLWAQNKVLFFDEAEGALEWQKQTGYPMESGLYYEAIGIFQTPEDLDKYPHLDVARTGDVIFKDVSGDGIINGDDMTRIYKNTVPTLTGGLTLTANYKGFDVYILLQGQAGAVRYIPFMGSKGGSNYMKTFYDNRWTEENTDATFPRTFNRNDEYWVSSDNPNTFWLWKTDFFRMKNLEIGYTLPEIISRKIGLSNLRVHAGGMNLITWSPDLKDFDPELEPKNDGFAGQGYPLQQILTVGINIGF